MPTFDKIMLPLLKTIQDGKIYKASEISRDIRDTHFNLTSDEKTTRLNNGRTKFYDRLLWARTYLKKAGLVTYPSTGTIQITERGKEEVKSNIKSIDVNYLMKYPEFVEFRTKTADSKESKKVSDNLSPQDLIETGYEKLNSSLQQELLDKIKNIDPYVFESVVLKLLKQMGYGDTLETSKSGDGGIDGVINQDVLGLDKIYIQCKRFNSHNVREPDIRNFIGAMSSDANKGIFVTTSDFDRKAIQKAKSASQKIILINGTKLAELMVKHNIGIQVANTFFIKEIDNDFFDE